MGKIHLIVAVRLDVPHEAYDNLVIAPAHALLHSALQGLRWEFRTAGRRAVSYQRAVLMGFSEWPDIKIDLDLDGQIAAYGTRIITSRGSIGHEGTVTVRGVVVDLDDT